MRSIYISAVILLMVVGYLLVISALPQKKVPKFKTSWRTTAKSYFSKKLNDDNVADKRFREIGLNNVNTYKYNVVRLAGFIGLCIMSLYRKSLLGLMLSIIIVLALEPKDKLLGTKSLFYIATDAVKKARGKRFDAEIYKLCVMLKNLAIVQKDNPWGAEYIFEQLIASSKELKPYLIDMLMQHRLGNGAIAFQTLGEAIGTKTGKEFAQILSKMDMLNPIEGVEQITIFQDNLQEQRLTEQLRGAENRSNVVYIVATITILILILNFTTIVMFMDAMAQMTNLL